MQGCRLLSCRPSSSPLLPFSLWVLVFLFFFCLFFLFLTQHHASTWSSCCGGVVVTLQYSIVRWDVMRCTYI